MKKINIKDEFSEHFPWHYDPLKENTDDCPSLGKLNFDFSSLKRRVLGLCNSQDPKKSGRGWSHYFEHDKVREDIIKSRPQSFQKMFAVWQDCGWTKDNSCFYEFQDEELGDLYMPIIDVYEQKFGRLQNKQLRVFVKPPMTALGLHCDTYNSYSRKYNVEQSKIFRVFTLVEDWEWGHYNLVGNNVIHQHRMGECYQIKPNVFHLSGNLGFNPMITMNLTGTVVS